MRYNEIINEDNQVLLINSEKRLNTMLSYGRVDLPRYTKVIIDIKKQYNINFPKNFTVNNSLQLRGRPRIISGDLTVKGHFKCTSSFTTFSGLKLKTSTMNISSNIKELPIELIVKGNLELWSTKATKLPNKLHIGGSLFLTSSNVTKLPKDFTVGKELYINGSAISKLPDDLTISGELNIAYTNITEIPDNLKVGGDIIISGNQKIKIPNHLKAKIITINR